MDLIISQVAPYPHVLEALVNNLTTYPNWSTSLRTMDRGQGSTGLTFIVTAMVPDSYQPDKMIYVNHFFIVPAASYNRDSWCRWLLNCLLQVSQHETCEFFKIDGVPEFAPHHGEGEDPYTIWHIGDLEAAKKKFTEK